MIYFLCVWRYDVLVLPMKYGIDIISMDKSIRSTDIDVKKLVQNIGWDIKF